MTADGDDQAHRRFKIDKVMYYFICKYAAEFFFTEIMFFINEMAIIIYNAKTFQKCHVLQKYPEDIICSSTMP